MSLHPGPFVCYLMYLIKNLCEVNTCIFISEGKAKSRGTCPRNLWAIRILIQDLNPCSQPLHFKPPPLLPRVWRQYQSLSEALVHSTPMMS